MRVFFIRPIAPRGKQGALFAHAAQNAFERRECGTIEADSLHRCYQHVLRFLALGKYGRGACNFKGPLKHTMDELGTKYV